MSTAGTHVNGIPQYPQLASFTQHKLIHFAVCVGTPLLSPSPLKKLFHSFLWCITFHHLGTLHSLFIHSSVDGRSVNKCHQYKHLVDHLLSVPLGVTPRSRTDGPFGNAMLNFLRIHQTVFHSSCTVFQFQQQYTRVPVVPHPCQYWLVSIIVVLIIIAILVNAK